MQAEAFGRDLDPILAAEWRAAGDAAANGREFALALHAVHCCQPMARQLDRRRRQKRTIGVFRPQAEARPTPILGAIDKLRSQRIALDVAQHGQEMLIALDRKRFEPPLPHVAAAAVMPVIAADVARQQPLHPATEIAVAVRPKDEVKMVWHQAPADQAHRQPLAGRFKQADEGFVILIFVKHLAPPIAPIEHMVKQFARLARAVRGMPTRLLQTAIGVKKK